MLEASVLLQISCKTSNCPKKDPPLNPNEDHSEIPKFSPYMTPPRFFGGLGGHGHPFRPDA